MSEKSTAQKLFLKPGQTLALLGAPAGYPTLLGDLPAGAHLATELGSDADVILCFVTSKAQLAELLPTLRAGLKPAGILWIAYPKGTSKTATDLNRDIIAAYAKGQGWQAVAIFSVDAVWSALRLKAE